MVVDFTPATWVPGSPPVAQFNEQIRDPWFQAQAPWTTYSTVWRSTGTQPSLGGGVLNGKYHRIGKTVFFRIEMLLAADSTVGTGNYTLDLPVKAAGIGRTVFDGIVRDESASVNYPLYGLVDPNGVALALRVLPNTAGNPLVGFTLSTPFTLTTNDAVVIGGCYEAE